MAHRHPDVSKRKASKSSISKGMKFNTKGKKETAVSLQECTHNTTIRQAADVALR